MKSVTEVLTTKVDERCIFTSLNSLLSFSLVVLHGMCFTQDFAILPSYRSEFVFVVI